MHGLHTVHAVPDLRIAGGRLGDDISNRPYRILPSQSHCKDSPTKPLAIVDAKQKIKATKGEERPNTVHGSVADSSVTLPFGAK